MGQPRWKPGLSRNDCVSTAKGSSSTSARLAPISKLFTFCFFPESAHDLGAGNGVTYVGGTAVVGLTGNALPGTAEAAVALALLESNGTVLARAWTWGQSSLQPVPGPVVWGARRSDPNPQPRHQHTRGMTPLDRLLLAGVDSPPRTFHLPAMPGNGTTLTRSVNT